MKINRSHDNSLLDGIINAPEFPSNLDWLNTDRPLRIEDLKGKIVLLDFWTYCCINCMHIIPDLKRLEKKYSKELLVIGVHSAKFLSEQETENIRNAVLRYEIEHPVVNDKNMEIWSSYGVRAWPTIVLINPLGKIIGSVSGEGIYDVFDKLISDAIDYFKKNGNLDEHEIDLKKEKDSFHSQLFSFPGKVLADENAKMLFVADSNNNRILGFDINDYQVKFIAGSGKEGLRDGNLENAEFNHPQGMAFDFRQKILYIADTENHSIRKIDINNGIVSTVAGIGAQRKSSDPLGLPQETTLNSPWDLVLIDDSLFIAMAGSHQIWRLDIKKNRITPFAGSGREALIDGPPIRAALAQPSGITTDGEKLFFADSETSSIRSSDLGFGGEVKTIVGEDLFIFGDRDGKASEVRLQHPLGITYYKKMLYIADTYNSKIKMIDPDRRLSITLSGNGEAGFKNGKRLQAQLNQPGGITAGFGKLYIADTNNHAIRIFNLATEELQTISFPENAPLALGKLKTELVKIGEEIEVPPGESSLIININLPAGCELNEDSPSYIKIVSKNDKILSFKDSDSTKTIKKPPLRSVLHINSSAGKTSLNIEAMVFYCDNENENSCFVLNSHLHLPVIIKKGNPGKDIEISLNT